MRLLLAGGGAVAKKKGPSGDLNQLYYGDNLEVMRDFIPSESIDLVYLDPPFNSNRSYNVIFGKHKATTAEAQIQAFDDTWTWTVNTEREYLNAIQGGVPIAVGNALTSFRTLLGENDALAYLTMMAPRLVEMHRVLKDTGSMYLHCDTTASHYLKVLLDAVFGPENFRSEITWVRTTTHNDAKRWSPNSDIILYYGKTTNVTWNPVHLPHNPEYVSDKYRFDDGDGRMYGLWDMTSPNPRPNLTYEWKGHQPPPNGWRYSVERMTELDAQGRIWYPNSKDKRPRLKRYLDEQPGPVAGNVWTDINPINSRAAERLGYPTQKPLALLERIIAASSNEGDVVLDPFCGCGTTVDAAQRLRRRWVGIDVTYIAVDLVEKRLEHTYGEAIHEQFEVLGIPRDINGAQRLFELSPFDFERWAVSLVNGQPNEKQVGDKGVDGIIRFYLDKNATGEVLVSVKGGKQLTPSMVRDLSGTVEARKAAMGLLITMGEPTKGMLEAASVGGLYEWPVNKAQFPRIQVVSVVDLLAGKRPNLPTALLPYIQASKHQNIENVGDQMGLAI